MKNSELKLYEKGNLEKEAKPFLKWAGGKTQLLNELASRLPLKIKTSKTIDRYVEPFVGGGAFFFFLKSNYEVKESFLYDINKELIIGYKVIQKDVQELMYELERIEDEYINLPEIDRKEYYYKTRDEYNNQQDNFNYETYNSDWIKRAAYLIFLNKTCFNGLFRQNKKGAFLILSNSDPKNVDMYDDFFDVLYSGFKIERVNAKRSINCDGKKRGSIKELVIRNYD
ncbi:Dam family site-specific DNA-(adenine-N6)-methyltransferase [Tepidanaerobacter sp. EBM-38]|uniref:Dam family site-specific DNA-(adenine-N6)-methyltransferase n=1 Tax=Tepidanaerobacter sp. EBM-38 TaxID=1918496 RepID=UPI000ADA87A6|nr:Dam family site-specific DNA-(adenine-N6)-methyltransferase [Tepidanaerobacter sp. EBM-38]